MMFGKLPSFQFVIRQAIDWSSWDARISNKEVLGCLKGFHEQQSKLLEQVLKEAINKGRMGWVRSSDS